MKTIYKTLLAALCCTMALGVQAQERTFHRNKVLIEKHTGTGCQACPAADEVVEKYIADINAEEDVAILRHHNYGSSLLNTASSSAIVGIWGAGVWPSMNVDRYGFFGDRKERTSCSTGNAYSLRSLETIERRLDTPTYVSLAFDGSTFDPATMTLRLVLSGEVTAKLRYLRIHAFITQSGIEAIQMGAPSGYIHNDAVRDRMMVDPQGDVLELNDDGTYCVVFEKTLDPKYGPIKTVAEDMKVVAFVSSYVDDTASFYDCDYSTSEVHNADVVALLDLPVVAPCAAPTIEYVAGSLVCTSATEGAVCHYDITPLTASADNGQGALSLTAPAFTVTAYATAEGFTPSSKVSRTFSLRDVVGDDATEVRDVDGNGLINKADVDALVDKLLMK